MIACHMHAACTNDIEPVQISMDTQPKPVITINTEQRI